ncbi:MAG: hypothetical protein ACK5LY_11010 [Lachnospirales bacterium]
MLTFQEKFKKELELFDKNRTEKHLKLVLNFGFLSYVLNKDENIKNSLKRIIFVANKELYNIEVSNAFQSVLDFYEGTINNVFFENNKNFYKNSYKLTKDEYYLFYLFTKSVSKAENSEKFLKELLKLAVNDSKAFIYVCSYFLYIEDYPNLQKYLILAYEKGVNSPYLFYIFGEYLKKGDINGCEKLLVKYIKWSINHKIEIYNILNLFFASENDNGIKDINLLYKIYNKTLNVNVLKILVKEILYTHKTYSDDEYKLFITAYSKQINLKGLNVVLIEAFTMFEYKEISYNTILDFLKIQNLSKKSLAYIYFIISSYSKYSNLEVIYKEDIFDFGYKALQKNCIDKEYLNIYNYILINHYEKLSEDNIIFIENLLLEYLFKYKINFYGKDENKVKVLWLKSKCFKEGDIYFTTEKITDIYALNDNFDIMFFDLGKKNILNVDFDLSPYIEGDNYKLYEYFYNKNKKNDFIVLSLALKNLENKNYDINIYEDVLKINLAKKYENLFKNILGVYHLQGNNINSSLNYLNEIEIVNSDLCKILIESKIKGRDIDEAFELIKKFYDVLEKQTIFDYISSIINEYSTVDVSVQCFELLLKNYYNSDTLNYIVKYYKGTIKEYKTLYKYANDTELRNNLINKVLDTYVNKKVFSSNTKEMNFFIRVLKDCCDKEHINIVCEYLTYEILVNSLFVPYDLITTLEKFYVEYNLEYLSIALSKLYVYNKTDLSELIVEKSISLCEKHNVVFPFMKELSYCDNNDFINHNHSVIYIQKYEEELYIKIKEKYEALDYLGFGIYYYTSVFFYGELISYSIYNTYNELLEEKSYKNQNKFVSEKTDVFYKVNNALVYESLHKYDLLEKEIEWLINEEENSYIIL